jgi:hypothetical protein
MKMMNLSLGQDNQLLGFGMMGKWNFLRHAPSARFVP